MCGLNVSELLNTEVATTQAQPRDEMRGEKGERTAERREKRGGRRNATDTKAVQKV